MEFQLARLGHKFTRVKRPPGSKHFVIAFRCGRLANRLVIFANFIGYALEHGHRVSNVSFHSYASQFENTCGDIYCRFPAGQPVSLLDRVPVLADAIRKSRVFFHVARYTAAANSRIAPFGRRVVTLRETPGGSVINLEAPEVEAQFHDARMVFVYGWCFRSPICVQRHAEAIRAYFKPVSAVVRQSRAVVAPLRDTAEVIIGVHIRRGDYQTWRGGQCYFQVSQYVEWMRELAVQFPSQRVAFLVCSDEPRKADEFPGMKVGFGPGFPAGDLYALSECDFILGPLSTFSQWASFYGNKPLFHLRDMNAKVERSQFCVSDLQEIP